MQLLKVSTLSAGVRVVTKGRRRAFAPRGHGSAGGKFSRRAWFGEMLVLGEQDMLENKCTFTHSASGQPCGKPLAGTSLAGALW